MVAAALQLTRGRLWATDVEPTTVRGLITIVIAVAFIAGYGLVGGAPVDPEVTRPLPATPWAGASDALAAPERPRGLRLVVLRGLALAPLAGGILAERGALAIAAGVVTFALAGALSAFIEALAARASRAWARACGALASGAVLGLGALAAHAQAIFAASAVKGHASAQRATIAALGSLDAFAWTIALLLACAAAIAAFASIRQRRMGDVIGPAAACGLAIGLASALLNARAGQLDLPAIGLLAAGACVMTAVLAPALFGLAIFARIMDGWLAVELARGDEPPA